ncbi:ABC transporter permease [Kitasatospora sp. NPDC092948]|uniref:ABC transporter permease n=1 Tax=Kitasatospora sp. NPDC092948 TaxID=3364088 RepID=UPI0037F926E8
MTARRYGLWIGLAILLVLAVMVVTPGLFTGGDPNGTDLHAVLVPPSGSHLLGTDQNGRDLYARLVYGARPSLLIGVGAVAIALVGGALIGLAAALGGRLVDQLLSRLLEVLLSVPGLLLVFLLVAVLGRGTGPAVLGLAVVALPGFARVARAEVVGMRHRPYIEAAYGFGLRHAQVVVRHVLPNALSPVLSLGVVSLGATIVASSSLSFVGLGPQPPTAEWGAMLAGSRDLLGLAWWTAVFPGAAVAVAVLAVSVVGRHVQQILDRRQR